MNGYKKFFVLALALAMLLTLAACGSSPAAATVAASAATTPEATQPGSEPTEAATEASAATTIASGKKALVVYYSGSGNTRRVAEAVAQAANADIFEVVPTEVYTSEDLNWTNRNSRVSQEHDDESKRDVPLTTTEVPNWDSYDTVFIGYPIWWGIAAWPMNNFVKANDFTGKTVIPFATSSSSGMGQSGSLLAGMANGGDWQSGQRFRSGASDSDVQKWVNGLGLQ